MAAVKKKRKTSSRISSLIHDLNTTLGTNIRVGSDPYFEIQRIPTGSLVLDRITGGGFALGRHVELYGDENIGKSYVTMRTIALSQQRGKICALIDPEHSYDPEWFAFLGGHPEELLLDQPKNGEEAVASMMTLAKHAREVEIEVIGIDSVTSLIPSEESDTDPRTKDQPAGQARMMSKALRRITTANEKTLFIWVNQLRTDIGIKFGNPNVTSGGRALRYYATTRISMHRGTVVKEERIKAIGTKLSKKEVQVGRWVTCRVEKEKSTKPYGEGSFVFNNDLNGIDEAYEIIQLGLGDGLIEYSGKHYVYTDLDGNEYKGYEKKFAEIIRRNPEMREELVTAIRDNTIEKARLVGREDGP